MIDDFVENGLKKFKKGSFKKAGLALEPFNASDPSTTRIPGLMEFLTYHSGCFKLSPNAFSEYFTLMDIKGMRDLAVAVEEDDVMADFIENGLKKFKKGSFKKPYWQSRA